MDGGSTFTHVCVDSSQTVLEYHRPFQRDPFIHICVDSSQTILEHHRSFIPSTLAAERGKKTQGSRWESNPGLLQVL